MKTKYFVIVLLSAAVGFGGCGKKKEKSSEKAILEFWVNNVQYSISGTNITYLYPKVSENTWTGYPGMPVAPSKVVLSPGATLDPPATTPRDFETGQTYTVTAENGSKQTYKVQVQKTMYVD